MLRPGAPLLVSAHIGTGAFTAPGAAGLPVTCTLHTELELVDALDAAGFTVDEIRRRDPLPTERPGERSYLAATAAERFVP